MRCEIIIHLTTSRFRATPARVKSNALTQPLIFDPDIFTVAYLYVRTCHPAYQAAQMARCYILGCLHSAVRLFLRPSVRRRLEDIFRKCMKAFGSLFSFLSFSISRDTMERSGRRAPSDRALKKAPSTTPLLYSYLCPRPPILLRPRLNIADRRTWV